MRKIFIKDIFNILLLSLIQTYKYELTLIVGGLMSKGQVGVLLGEHRGWMLHMAFSYKAKNIVYNSMLSYALTSYL